MLHDSSQIDSVRLRNGIHKSSDKRNKEQLKNKELRIKKGYVRNPRNQKKRPVLNVALLPFRTKFKNLIRLKHGSRTTFETI